MHIQLDALVLRKADRLRQTGHMLHARCPCNLQCREWSGHLQGASFPPVNASESDSVANPPVVIL